MVAPAMAWNELGGTGTQRSSQISTPTTTLPQPIRRAASRLEEKIDPKRHPRPPRSISAGTLPAAGLNQRLS